MNQILFNSSFSDLPPEEESNKKISKKEKKNLFIILSDKISSSFSFVRNASFFQKLPQSKKPFYFVIFSTCIFFIFVALFSYGFYYYDQKQSEQLADHLSNMVRISSIYSLPNTNTIENVQASDAIIGTIEIPSINIHYPIFAQTEDSLLKIGPCRFYGPMPNEIGNLCIAGHNYDNQKFFSNLYKLKPSDEILITDLSGKTLSYAVTKTTEVSSSDTSAITQDTNGKRILTLITCNNKNGNRLLIEADEKK